MSFANFHTHTEFCDAIDSAEEMVEAAVREGYVYLGLSSHAELPFETDWTMKQGRLPEYLALLDRLREKYRESLQLYSGLEVDYIPGRTSARKTLFQEANLDFMISSIHYLGNLPNGEEWSIDESDNLFFIGLKSLYQENGLALAKHFFRTTCEMIELGGFDIVGHIDKIAQYNIDNCYFNVSDKAYKSSIEECFQLAKERDIMIEVNTKEIERRGMSFPSYTHFPLLKEKKIRIVLNSDTHRSNCLSTGRAETAQALRRAGIRSQWILHNHRWTEVGIEEDGGIGW